MRLAVLGVLAACAHPSPHGAGRGTSPGDAPSEALPADQRRLYTIWLGGAQVGTAVETEAWTRAGVALVRTEHLAFLRGDVPVELTTTIEIAADAALVPSSVHWTERGISSRSGEAARGPRGWTATLDGTTLALPPDAIPAELVPLLLRRDHRFGGAVFLPARGFMAGRGHIELVAPGRLVARLTLDAGPIVEATIDLELDGTPARVVDGEGVIVMRATAAQAAASYPPVDLIAATSVPVTGVPARGAHGHRIALIGDVAVPAVPGQAARISGGALELELSSTLPGDLPDGIRGPDRGRDITSLVAGVRGRISPDLRAGGTSPRDAAAATAGDCTTFALAYAALATRSGIPTRVVTGLRVDGDHLIRHRWAVSWTGRAWIAVDSAFGAAPAGGDLIGLAIHDADDAGLIAGEAALTSVRGAAWL